MESGLQIAGSRHRTECSRRKVKHIGSQQRMNYIYRDRGTNWISDGQIYGRKNAICAGQVEPRLVALTVGAALQTGPSDRCSLQVGLDASFQAHVLLLHGVESVAHRVHHLHHVDLAVGQQLQHTQRDKRECTFIFMNNVIVPNVYQTIQYVYLLVGIVLNSQNAMHACAGPNLRGRSRRWHILLVIFSLCMSHVRM